MADSSSNDASKMLIGQQKGFDYFIMEIKSIIFNVLFVLLKEEE